LASTSEKLDDRAQQSATPLLVSAPNPGGNGKKVGIGRVGNGGKKGMPFGGGGGGRGRGRGFRWGRLGSRQQIAATCTARSSRAGGIIRQRSYFAHKRSNTLPPSATQGGPQR
jgi:hypothetical protein